jgi:hypothetical protein
MEAPTVEFFARNKRKRHAAIVRHDICRGAIGPFSSVADAAFSMVAKRSRSTKNSGGLSTTRIACPLGRAVSIWMVRSGRGG